MTPGDEAVQLADRVEAAVLAVPDVVSLHGGAFGEVATYLPGRRVAGVAVRDDEAEVHVVVAYGADVRQTAVRVQEAVHAIVGTPVNVTVEDVVPAPSAPSPTVATPDDHSPEPHTSVNAGPNAEPNAEPKERS